MLTFKETGLKPELLSAIEEMGFISPTPVQAETIPHLLDTDDDMLVLAQTGTGKTAAFGLPVLQKTKIEDNYPQTLILSPTRELCVQIAKDIQNFAAHMPEINIVAVYGGANIETQIRQLKKGAHIVVGTPGRTIDLIERKILKPGRIRFLILDEADEMLNMGFKEDLDIILKDTPETKQTLLFSATMPPDIRRIADEYMNKPKEITIGRKNQSTETVTHAYYVAHAKDRYRVLKRIADINPNIYGIVFCRTREETKDTADKLMQDGYNADALHGDLSQVQRDRVMDLFRSGHLQLLVATDVAARGLDVDNLSHIINYNLPDDIEVYIHRSGRTGRAGKTGTCLSIINMRETGKIRELEKKTSKKFERLRIPGGKEICEKQLFNIIDEIGKIVVNESQIKQFLPQIYQQLEEFSREELVKRFVSAEFNRFLTYYKNAEDLNVEENSRDRDRDRDRDRKSDNRRESNRGDKRSETRDSGDRKKRKQRNEENFARLFINIGKTDSLSASSLIGLINETTRNRDISIGKIDIMKKFAFFEIDPKFVSQVKKSFNNVVFNGVSVVVDDAVDVNSSSKPERRKRRMND
jgi:ATP-dependent RNA helicase DeaD